MRVLLVDDDPAVRSSVRAVLQNAGHEVAEAAFGAAVAGKVRSFRPDVVVLDLVLPDASGRDLLKQIRAMPEGASVPVVAFSGYYATPEDASAAAPGFDSYIVKPLKVQRLLDVIRDLARRPAPGAEPPADSAPPDES